ncbi:MAG: hypothetical protein KF861_08905 [Planctomycetaceae bacterium]|nr:hypothetical protein [Planctomycetaceae bacterium]
MTDQLTKLEQQIEQAGFYAFIENEPAPRSPWKERVVCASHRRSKGGYHGISFWVAACDNTWLVGCWSGVVYRMSGAAIQQFCCDFLTSTNLSGTPDDVPEELRIRYSLQAETSSES